MTSNAAYEPVKQQRFDGIEDASDIDGDEYDNEDDDTLVVHIVAPSSLSEGERLLVKNQGGEVFSVTIPRGGVYKGQRFEASRAEPVYGQFSDNLFACTGGEGCMFWVACCCPGVAIASLMDKLNLTWCGTPQRGIVGRGRRPTAAAPAGWCSTFAVVTCVSIVFWIFYIIYYVNYIAVLEESASAPMFPAARTKEQEERLNRSSSRMMLAYVGVMSLGIFLILLSTRTRMAVRNKYSIEGTCCCDCMTSYCCACCSALQMYRHMVHSGDPPHYFSETPVFAGTV